MLATTLRAAVDEFLLYRDLAPETRKWYRRIVNVFCAWHGRSPLLEEFNGEAISRCIADKQAEGRSPYYLRSLRNGLVAILHEIRGNAPVERVRGVRCPRLRPEGWSDKEVDRLIHVGCQALPAASRWRYQLFILLAYYTSLDRCDLEKIEQRHFRSDGALLYSRQKTGGEPTSGIPLELLAWIRANCPRKGPICRMGISPEWFRRVFAGIVQRAGLFGTFKKLRKSSGSLVERDSPGTGHKHLGNTRGVFERHYEVREFTRGLPTLPPVVRLPWQ